MNTLEITRTQSSISDFDLEEYDDPITEDSRGGDAESEEDSLRNIPRSSSSSISTYLSRTHRGDHSREKRSEGSSARRPLSPLVRHAARRASLSFSESTSPATPRTLENERQGDNDVQYLLRSIEASKKLGAGRPKIKVNIPVGALQKKNAKQGANTSEDNRKNKDMGAGRTRSASNICLSPRVFAAATNSSRRRSLSMSSGRAVLDIPTMLSSEDSDEGEDSSSLPQWARGKDSPPSKNRYTMTELRKMQFIGTNTCRPTDMPAPPVELDRLTIRGAEQGLYMCTIVKNALLVLELVLDASRTSPKGMRISTLGSKFKIAHPKLFYRGITRDLVPVIVDAGLATRCTVEGDLFLRLTTDAVVRRNVKRPGSSRIYARHFIIKTARSRLERAFRMQRVTVEESDAASVASNRSDPREDDDNSEKDAFAYASLVPRTIDNVLGTRISGHVYKSGSVYGFIKADFEKPDLGEIFFLAREVQGKQRLDVGAHVTFEVSRKGEKFRALRIVPLAVPLPSSVASLGDTESKATPSTSNTLTKSPSDQPNWRRAPRKAEPAKGIERVSSKSLLSSDVDSKRDGFRGGQNSRRQHRRSNNRDARRDMRGFRRERMTPSSGRRNGRFSHASSEKKYPTADAQIAEAGLSLFSRGPDGTKGFARSPPGFSRNRRF